MNNNLNKRKKLAIVLLLSIVYVFSVLFIETYADPVGAAVINISTLSGAIAPDSRADDGGLIVITTMDTVQQNFNWKAYVGNMTASLTLDDSLGRTIYGWTILQASLTGELYATRINSISWSGLSCANSTNIDIEHTYLGMNGISSDSINNTFSYSSHPTYIIAGQTILNDTCDSLFTYINDTAQLDDENSSFSEIVLQNTNGEIIYATGLENDLYGYSGQNNITYDFQLIVPDNDAAGNQTTYYFYAEIDS